ncbi:hypothetical protein ACFSCV_08735 [Methylopila henanensis]|uniref:Uncharacterized protein n=1 Tax=Methylopila henanensis TaxID=873516 RepID=A0ABW4K787_9HYPH
MQAFADRRERVLRRGCVLPAPLEVANDKTLARALAFEIEIVDKTSRDRSAAIEGGHGVFHGASPRLQARAAWSLSLAPCY